MRHWIQTACVFWLSIHSVIAAAAEAASPDIQRTFFIKQIELRGVSGDLVPPDAILNQPLKLTRQHDGLYVVAPAQAQVPTVTLGQIGGPDHAGWRVDASVIRAMAGAVFSLYRQGQWAAVRVSVPRQTLAQLTPQGSGVLWIDVNEGRVGHVRVLQRDGDNPLGEIHDAMSDRVLRLSPLSVGQPVQTQQLTRYVDWLNRHPGRRVDVALNPGTDEHDLGLDFIVTQRKPWSVYFQASNTGTANTPRWRQRFGGVHTNLTGADDVLTMDYITSGFADVNAFSGSYERPIPRLFGERIRVRLFGTWSEYLASDVGLAGLNLTGRSFGVGGEVIANVFQHQKTFLDLVTGIKYEHVDSDNGTLGLEGTTGFVIPYLGVRGDRRTDTTTTFGSAILETSWPGVVDTSALLALGRLNTSPVWWTLKYSLGHAFYLEPLFDPQWGQPGSNSTLAHELSASVRGQYVFGDQRVAPNFTQTVGGLYTVRGYPESFSAGDSILIANFEYRLHIPRLFGPGEPIDVFHHPFKVRPTRMLGSTDWDLILKAFLDVGRSVNNDRFSFENNNTLVGAGVGVEWSLMTYFSSRFEWGWALADAQNGSQSWDAGEMRLHMLFTLSY